MKKDTGGPAFPMLGHTEDGEFEADTQFMGMTLRDYFAANASEQDVALQGEVIREKIISAHGIGILPDSWRPTARYMHADAMLAERNK